MSKERESLGSRLGFLLLTAGCAIGLGNIWRFPYVTGKFGGALFVAFYILFLLLMGLALLIIELSVGRGSQISVDDSSRNILYRQHFSDDFLHHCHRLDDRLCLRLCAGGDFSVDRNGGCRTL